MASYFSYFPNVYVGEGVTSDENYTYRLVKNIFRRVKARDELNRYTTFFEAYSIKPDETPSSLAQRIYGDPYYDWVILVVNNITDIYNEWPKKESDLQEFVEQKYDDPDAIHHYETNEVLYNGIVYMKEGTEVNSTFRVTMPDGVVLSETDSIYPVSNYEYEYYENEKKRLITVPNGAALSIIENEMRELMDYEDHVEIDSDGNKKTPLNIAGRFTKISGSSNASSNFT